MSNHHPIIIFDVDGVLLKSTGHLLTILHLMKDKSLGWNEKLLKKLRPIDILRKFEAGAKDRSYESLKTIYLNFVELIPSRLRRWRLLIQMGRRINKMDWLYNDFFPKTREILESLKETGILIGAASNSTGDRISRWLKRKGVADIFRHYTSRDDRKEVGVKPSPGPLYKVLIKIKNYYQLGKIDRTRVAFVGDLGTDIIAGKKANVKTIGVLSGHSSQKELEMYEPDFILENITKIPQNISKIFPNFSP